MNSQHRPSAFEPVYAVYDRYKNIIARGSCIKRILGKNFICFISRESNCCSFNR